MTALRSYPFQCHRKDEYNENEPGIYLVGDSRRIRLQSGCDDHDFYHVVSNVGIAV